MERNRLESADANVQDSIHTVLRHIEEEIRRTLKAIEDHIDSDPDLRQRKELLTSIKGFGDQTAALLLGELGDPLAFRSAKAVAAFAGLTPRPDQSGEHQGPTPISRIGSGFLRSRLYMPAIVAMQHNPAIKALANRLRSRGKSGKQIVCAAMRKLLHIAYGVLKSGQPFDPELALAR
jgi:transposase